MQTSSFVHQTGLEQFGDGTPIALASLPDFKKLAGTCLPSLEVCFENFYQASKSP